MEESINTLKFLERAKVIKTQVINKVFHENPEMRNLEKEIAYLKDILKMKRTGVELDVNMAEKVKKLQTENRKLKEMVDRDLVERLTKENNILKRELDKKQNDELLSHYYENSSKTIEDMKEANSPFRERESVGNDKSEAGQSYSSNKIVRKEKKLLTTKTYTNQ